VTGIKFTDPISKGGWGYLYVYIFQFWIKLFYKFKCLYF